jgi:hypothetical protein
MVSVVSLTEPDGVSMIKQRWAAGRAGPGSPGLSVRRFDQAVVITPCLCRRVIRHYDSKSLLTHDLRGSYDGDRLPGA